MTTFGRSECRDGFLSILPNGRNGDDVKNEENTKGEEEERKEEW